MDGAFPDMGHHLPGEMGGLWAFPVKLADGFWFGVAERDAESAPGETQWMHGTACRNFTLKAGGAEREFSLSVGVGNAGDIRARTGAWGNY
jgi:hypothetical protein